MRSQWQIKNSVASLNCLAQGEGCGPNYNNLCKEVNPS